MGKTLKVGAGAVAVAAGAIVGTGLAKGFGRLKGIEQAQAKLTGLGHDVRSVEKIMKNATDAVTGTAFGLDAAATVAASAVAAGVKPGKQLERTLTLVGDAATIAGVGMDEMGAIFNKVAASNKIQGDVIAQLNDAGIPIIQLLSKELGKSAEATLDLASDGKINFATFQKAMEAGLGGAAQESGKTFTGSLANMQAALGRLGAKVLGGVFSKMPAVFQNLGEKLDTLGPAAEQFGEKVGEAFAWVSAKLTSLDWSGLRDDLAPLLARLKNGAVSLWESAKSLAPTLNDLKDQVLPLLGEAVDTATAAFESAASKVEDLTTWAKDHGTELKVLAGVLLTIASPAIIAWATTSVTSWTSAKIAAIASIATQVAGLYSMVGAFMAATAAAVASRVATLYLYTLYAIDGARAIATAVAGQVALAAAYLRSTAAAVAARVAAIAGAAALGAQAAATGVVTAAQWAFNAALWANPITWVVAGVLALIAVFALLVVAYRKNEKFRAIVDKGFELLRKAVTGCMNALIGLPATIQGAFRGAKDWLLNAGRDIINGLKAGIENAKDAAVQAARNVGSSIKSAVTGFFKIKSPSRVMRDEVGVWLPRGIAAGIVKGTPSALKAAKSLGEKVVEQFKSVRDGVKQAFTVDVFGGSFTDFKTGLAKYAADTKAALAALPQLVAKGAKGDFLTSLMSSGNTGLILALAAGSSADLQADQKLWTAANRTTSTLANQVAGLDTGADLGETNKLLKSIDRTLARQEKEAKAREKRVTSKAKKGRKGKKK